jgi:hypothetical protein
MSIIDDFKENYKAIVEETTGTDSAYGKLLSTLTTIFDDSNMTQRDKTAVITEVAAQLSTQAISSSVNGAIELTMTSARIALLNAQKDYEVSKKNVTEQSRIDNLLIEASKAQEQKLATVGAGGLTPSVNDFKASNDLRGAIYQRAKSPDETLPDITFEAGTAYVKV